VIQFGNEWRRALREPKVTALETGINLLDGPATDDDALKTFTHQQRVISPGDDDIGKRIADVGWYSPTRSSKALAHRRLPVGR
jgi:hypothetical protein